MPLGEIETVILNVPDVEKAAAFWGDLLDIAFEPITEFSLPGGVLCKSAWAPKYGFELIEQTTPKLGVEGVRSVAFRVRDIDAAKAKMAERGIPIVADNVLERAHEHEVIYNLGGFRFILTEHDDYE
jgi:catechol 2,3-dioxygenase-like lactoylglutathione lyase family enzyme